MPDLKTPVDVKFITLPGALSKEIPASDLSVLEWDGRILTVFQAPGETITPRLASPDGLSNSTCQVAEIGQRGFEEVVRIARGAVGINRQRRAK
jgi:hypothetical protein